MSSLDIKVLNKINKNVYDIRGLFRGYYKNNFVNSPIVINQREVGIGEYNKKISSRHLSFETLDSLNTYLRSTTPFFISYSVGYYKYPSKRGPMAGKDLLGADIVYEFDSDDFDLGCKNEHDIWVCKNSECRKHGKGHVSHCPECESQTEITEWTCDKCLGKAKSETLRLIDFLETDFKLSSEHFIISFSGAKGYHIRLTNPSIISLSKSARLQMMDYVLAKNLDLEQLGFEHKRTWISPNPETASGWSKKILDFMIEYIKNATPEQLKTDFGFGKTRSQNILNKKDDILNKMCSNILYSDFSNSSKFWQDLINLSISKTAFKIDPMSSSDIYKIMRMPDTIHGGTGFLSNTIKTIEDLNDFDAYSDPVVIGLKSYKKIKILKPTPKFRIKDRFYGPYGFDEELDLPLAVAVFLILKGVAI